MRAGRGSLRVARSVYGSVSGAAGPMKSKTFQYHSGPVQKGLAGAGGGRGAEIGGGCECVHCVLHWRRFAIPCLT
jgi:hypothetical protein